MVGLPLIAFPTGAAEVEGLRLPVGAVLGGQPFAEDRLLSLVGAFQAVTDWHRQRPSEALLEAAAAAAAAGDGDRGDGRRMDVLEVEAESQ
jgi:aspartyl-tRNA(Asn)/glutamyl-tRNA(Gln) amidotransferase subunit A